MDKSYSMEIYFRQILSRLSAESSRSLKARNLTYSQMHVLLYLKRNEDRKVTQKDIGDYLKIRHTSVIDLLRRLEDKDMIERHVDADNSRYRVVTLTGAGYEAVQEMDDQAKAMDAVMRKGISDDEMEALGALLNRVLNNLNELPG